MTFRGLLASLLAGVLAFPVNAPAFARPAPGPDWLAGLRAPSAEPAPVTPPPVVRLPVVARSQPTSPAVVTLPAAGSHEITLGSAPVRLAGGVLAVSGPARLGGTRVRVDILDQATTARAGVPGLLLRTTRPVTVSVDYAGFGHAYGGGFADRLRAVALPECVLQAPRPTTCRGEGTALPTHADPAAQRLTIDGATGLLAVTSGVSGPTGTFAATPLSPSGDWQVAPGSGEFSWSYPLTVADPPAGTSPSVALSYSSGSVDGMVSTRNTQGPRTGVGWAEFASAYVERRYTSCATTIGTGDMCWQSDNATLSLNGHSGELIPVDQGHTRWRLKNDPGWLVERLHLTDTTNGDDNGEYWRVTTPDGLAYHFGLGTNPDTQTATNATWTVPVLADHSGEPCRGGGDTVGSCDQAWRWNLDRVVDPNGLTTTYYYFKSINRYRAVNGLGNHQQPYVRGGRLDRVEYGKPAGTDATVSAAGRITFGGEYRCANLNDACPAPTQANGSLFPDVPNDLICVSECLVTTPTFFATDRYAWVRSEVRVAGAWRPVEQLNLLHGFWANSDGDQKMYLNALQRVGLAQSSLLPLPTILFWPTVLPNRVDVNVSAGRKPMQHIRVGGIIDEYGHQTWVTYGQKSTCPATKAGSSVRWDLNTQDCFPQKLGSTWATFHKYLTTKVEEVDPTGGSPPMVTTYAYEGTPAWHHDDDESSAAADQSWSDWRGYGSTTVTQGASKNRVQLFRGMHGDKMSVGSPRTVLIEPFDGAGFDDVPAINDDPWLAGLTLAEADLGTAGETLAAVRHEYGVRVTAQRSVDPQDWAVWTGETVVTSNVASGPGTFAARRTTTSYNPYAQIESVYEEGSLSRTGDERCTRTTYAVNEAASLLQFPASHTVVAGACASTTVVSETETYYDGSTVLGAPPTRGNPTRQRVRLEAARWALSAQTTYDAQGRVTRVVDGAGAVTDTGYETTLAGGFPRTTTETRFVGAATHVTTTEWLPEYGVPLRITDPNGNVTSYAYDGLGRLLSVVLPTEQPPAANKPASWTYAYVVAPNRDAVPVVRTTRLIGAGRVEDSWVVYDSALRERQTQTRSPEAGKVLVTTTVYDDRGLVAERIAPQAVTGTAGVGLLSATWENRTRLTYDPLGRVTREATLRGAAEVWSNATSYTHDSVTVDEPGGRRARTRTDALDRTVRAEEWDGTAWRATDYAYDLADRLTSTVDPAGHAIFYTYNLAGWRLTMNDPDAGLWRFGYDDAGRQISVTDGAGGVTTTAYDALGRPTERRTGAGALLATWGYDAPGEKGWLDRSTRVTAGGNWVLDISGYDARGRPRGESLTVPAGLPGLSGSYPVTYGYDGADRVTTIGYPAVGGLPAETVTTQYSATGLPERLVGLDEYVWTAQYDNRARPTLIGLGRSTGLAQNLTYDADQRLSRVQTALDGALATEHQFTYDAAGTLLDRTTRLGAQSWRECYGYDQRDRLVEAYTVAVAATCATGTRGTGDQPYSHSYRYGVDGDFAQRIEGSTTLAYGYDAGHPHAPTSVGPATYQWDANGNLTRRTVGGVTDTLAWDAERRLASVTRPTGTDSFVYDADGQRVLRTTTQGRTVYFAGHEVTADPTGSVVTATRSYTLGDQTVATRTPGGVEYLVADQQGSIEASLPAGGPPRVTRAYTPYGQRRSGGEFATDHGWLGEVEDDSTGLAYLNARYYDPGLARFVSPDPVYDQAEPQSVNPYAYGLNNPVGNTDPGGALAKGVLKKLIARAFAAVVRAVARVVVRAAVRAGAVVAKQVAKVAVSRKAHAKQLAAERAFKAAILKARADRKALAAMHRANPDPRFWQAVAKVGAKEMLRVANQIKHERKVRRLHGLAQQIDFGRFGGIAGAELAENDDDGDDGGCGWGWSGLGNCVQSAGHVIRFTTNLPYTVPSVGWAYLNGGSCRMRHGLMVACTDMDWGYGWRRGFTVGNTYLTDADEVSDEDLRHEAGHATQWAIFGPATPGVYFLDYAIAWGNPCRQVMEKWAGKRGSGYHC